MHPVAKIVCGALALVVLFYVAMGFWMFDDPIGNLREADATVISYTPAGTFQDADGLVNRYDSKVVVRFKGQDVPARLGSVGGESLQPGEVVTATVRVGKFTHHLYEVAFVRKKQEGQ